MAPPGTRSGGMNYSLLKDSSIDRLLGGVEMAGKKRKGEESKNVKEVKRRKNTKSSSSSSSSTSSSSSSPSPSSLTLVEKLFNVFDQDEKLKEKILLFKSIEITQVFFFFHFPSFPLFTSHPFCIFLDVAVDENPTWFTL